MPEERIDIHRMGWRFANACLIKLKLSDVQNASWWEARATLERLLEDLITQAVRRRWGQLSLDVTLRTVAIALDSIRACNLYYLSPQILRLYVLSAFKVLNKQPPEEAERNCRPEWYLVLTGLIDLPRAPWTYLRLAAARSVGFGWKRRLTRDYLGPNHDPC